MSAAGPHAYCLCLQPFIFINQKPVESGKPDSSLYEQYNKVAYEPLWGGMGLSLFSVCGVLLI